MALAFGQVNSAFQLSAVKCFLFISISYNISSKLMWFPDEWYYLSSQCMRLVLWAVRTWNSFNKQIKNDIKTHSLHRLKTCSLFFRSQWFIIPSVNGLNNRRILSLLYDSRSLISCHIIYNYLKTKIIWRIYLLQLSPAVAFFFQCEIPNHKLYFNLLHFYDSHMKVTNDHVHQLFGYFWNTLESPTQSV